MYSHNTKNKKENQNSENLNFLLESQFIPSFNKFDYIHNSNATSMVAKAMINM